MNLPFTRFYKKQPPPGNPRLRLSWLNEPGLIGRFHAIAVDRKEIRRLLRLGERFETESKLFDLSIRLTSPFWYLHGLKEIFIDETYRFECDSASPYILDCGANIGLSIIYFSKMFPLAKIVAFEPDEAIFELLKHNTAGLNADLTLIRKAVWTSVTSLEFSADQAVGGTLMRVDSKPATTGLKQVRTARLRDYLDKPVDLLKIDIEGAEFDVIADCKERLGWVKNLFIEYHSLPTQPQRLPELLGILKEAGFRFYVKEAWENMTHPFAEKKGIFYDLQLNIFAYRM